MSLTLPDNVFGNYARLSDTYDGLWDESGQVRDDWKSLFDSLQSLGQEELKYKHSEIQRLLRENGVTYNVYGDPAGLYRSWKLDAIPFLINKEEWKKIEAGLIQRANLLNLILTDIYGKRELVKNGLLPLDLIYNHNGFLRPCDGIKLPGENQLFMYAVDIAKAKDGSLWILNDRTQAPSGSGYALENRSVMSKVMPEIFQGYEIRKLNDFFNTLHNSLVSIAPKGVSNPRIVLLTPGPGNETYFEHAYLSAYLGYNLVQGEDLTVRDGYVWMKTIQGLERVDIILRRVDDSFCDPLELRLDSRLGIPGLLETVRKGHVVVANPLGSSILENSGIMAFLPGLCKHYFNEDLILPSLNTWWCGQPEELKYVLENLNDLSIKMIHRRDASRTISHGNLDSHQAENLKRLILAKPYLYVAHEQLQISTIPSLVDGNTDRRFAVLRCFLVAKNGSYVIMPGGLTRSSAERDIFKVSNQYGGISKDTWVLDAEDNLSINTYLPSVPVLNENFILPSRTAENMFWAGRYATRAKMTSRFLRDLLSHFTGSSLLESGVEKEVVKVLLKSLTHLTMMYPGFIGEGGEEKLKNPEEELFSVLLNFRNSGSLSSTIRFFKRTIFSIRNRWPADTWRVIDNIDESWKTLERAPVKSIHLTRATLENIINSFVAFMGLNLESIPRDHAYVLLNTGRRIEKCLLLISQIRSSLVIAKSEQVEYALMETVLSSNMSLTIYRSRFRSYLQMEACLDLLLYDISNPASVLHNLERLKEYLDLLPIKQQGMGRLSNQQKVIIEAYALLQTKDSATLMYVDPSTGLRKELDQMLSQLSKLVAQISDALIAEYFTHSESSQLLFTTMDEEKYEL